MRLIRFSKRYPSCHVLVLSLLPPCEARLASSSSLPVVFVMIHAPSLFSSQPSSFPILPFFARCLSISLSHLVFLCWTVIGEINFKHFCQERSSTLYQIRATLSSFHRASVSNHAGNRTILRPKVTYAYMHRIACLLHVSNFKRLRKSLINLTTMLYRNDA